MNRVIPTLALATAALALASCSTQPPAVSTTPAAVRPVWPDEGPATWTPRPTTAAITANDLRTRLYQFADDSMMGRDVGTQGNYKGTEYIAREFARLGLRPAGDNGTYFQALPWGTMGFATGARLAAGARALTPVHDWIPLAPSGATGFGGGADLTGVPTVFAGRWGDTTSALDAAAVAGKVAVFIAQPAAAGIFVRPLAPLMRCDSLPNRFGAAAAVIAAAEAARADSIAGRDRSAPGRRGSGASRDMRAQRAGARAILLVTLDSVPVGLRIGAVSDREGMRQTLPDGAPAAAITARTAMALFGKPLDQLAVGDAGQPVSAHWAWTFTPARWPARNVIAVLPGSDPARAGEYVLVSAHNDHVGTSSVAVDHDSLRAVNTVTRRQGANDPICRPTVDQQRRIDSMIAHARSIRPPRRDSIYNGADDDGSGTVVLLEIAERFAQEHPARSILFVSHQGEEAGLLGSRWFTDHPTVPLTAIVAAHNMDMLAKGHVEQVKFGGPASLQILGARRLSREFGDMIDSVNAVRAEVMALDKTWDVPANPMNRFCRSDQVNYVRHHVPVTYFSTGYAQDYHQPTDEPRYVDYEHVARVGRFIHDVMSAIANRRDRLAITGPDQPYPDC